MRKTGMTANMIRLSAAAPAYEQGGQWEKETPPGKLFIIKHWLDVVLKVPCHSASVRRCKASTVVSVEGVRSTLNKLELRIWDGEWY